MNDESNPPMLLTFLFGDAAQVAHRGASDRLLIWCRAYDDWLAERQRTFQSSATYQSVMDWRRLVQHSGKTPWELTAADIEQHTAWLAAQGYSPSTISGALGIISNFYRWCSARQVDPQCGAGFNPAAGVKRPALQRYAGAQLLSRDEVARLLNTIAHDPSELARRDYAFILARLRLGVSLDALRQLKWGQIEHDAQGAWVRWRSRAGGERARLPDEVWQAIRAALQAAGRLAGMRAADYIFAPLADPFKAMAGAGMARAEDWQVGRCLTVTQIWTDLKLYGRLAGIAEDKLTLQALRRTATRLRLDEGASLAQMQVFLDSHERAPATKYRLGQLPELPPDEGGPDQVQDGVPTLRNRIPKLFEPGEGVTHGFYAHSQPPEMVAAVLAENIRGMGDEIAGLRMLARGLLERQGQARNDQEAAQLWEAYNQAASRLGEIIRTENALEKDGQPNQWAEDVLEMLDRLAIESGGEPVSDGIRKAALGGEPELSAAARQVVEEVASMRHVLRNIFKLGVEAHTTPQHIHMVEIYSRGCVQLVKLLKMEGMAGAGSDRLEAYLRAELDKAIRINAKEMGLI